VDIRRFVTVVTSDLKGSTALGERFDPETLRELLGLYFDEMRLVFESNGGRIEKIIGDAIVAVFGPTTDRVDDALRGLEAAADSRRALASLNDRLEATWGVRLVVRTGAASGDVFFGEAAEGQQVLTGPTMTIATAMEQHCPPMEVLVAASTVELVGDRIETEPLGPVTPKGTELVIESFRLVAVQERSAAEQAAASHATPGGNRCPACGEENPDAFTRCGMCGQTLVRSAVAHDTRKTVTIVFADPSRGRSTAAARPEALREVMPRYFDAMKEALEHHGGTVEKFIGDAVMAVYGLPVRHEDDAVRAVRAAAAMQAALPALNEGFRRDWGLELRNHIGVNTGEVIAGDASLGQRLVTGDAVNTAARLEQAAGAQEVILGHLTYLLARDQIEVEPIAPLTLKGKAEPVPAYRLAGVRQRPAERVAGTTPFVGRSAEMERLRDALLDAERQNGARLMTVIGDAGVGKSRLVREFAGSLRDDVQVLRGRCLPYGDGVAFWPIGEIVRAAASITDDDDAAAALAKIARSSATTRRGHRRATRRRSLPASAPRSAFQPRSSSSPSSSGASGSCSKRWRAGARSSRSWTTSSGPRPRSSSSSTTCSRSRRVRQCSCWRRPATSCSRSTGIGRSPIATGRSSSSRCRMRMRPRSSTRSSMGSTSPCAPGSPKPPRKPAVRRADHGELVETDTPRRRRLSHDLGIGRLLSRRRFRFVAARLDAGRRGARSSSRLRSSACPSPAMPCRS
jgi:class 3 adenylate cyclase